VVSVTNSVWQLPSDRQTREADAVVVGGGIAGVAAAMYLRQRGLRVILLEARSLAACASGRNVGFVLTGTAEHYAAAVARYGRTRAREAWSASLANRSRLFAVAEGLGVPLERCGSVLACVDGEEAAAARASAELLQADGFEGTFAPRDPLGRGFAAALVKPGDAAVDPVRLVRAMAASSGAEVWERCPAYEVRPGTVRCARGMVRARVCVVAAGPYTPQLLPPLAGAIAPVRAQVLSTGPGPRVLETLVYANHGYDYVRQLPDGRLLAGGSRDHALAEEVGFEDRVTPTVQGAIEGFVRQYFPDVRAPVDLRWSGVMEFTSDLLPLVGPVPDMPGVLVCAGFSGHGLAFALEAAARAVACALDGASPGVFHVSRVTAA
jgi:gamma-glutamylputrescine oxidase